MLTSKEIIERTGISRATLNNYIGSGLVPRPEVLQPRPEDGAAPRIGYFPDDTIARIEVIQRLKREGWSIERIAAHFAKPESVPDSPAEAPAVRAARSPTLTQAGTPSVTSRVAPALTSVAILFSTLHDAPGLWVKLNAQEYFELVDEVWSTLDQAFSLHGGVAGRHPDEGFVRYFQQHGQPGSHLWNALAAAHEARRTMVQLSRRWQARKGWDVELAMNTGLDEGREWMGAIGAGGLRVMGEAAERAESLSRASRPGAILVTRSFIGKLTPQERSRVVFGVPRPSEGEPPLLSTFARLGDIAGARPVSPHAHSLAVAEMLDLS